MASSYRRILAASAAGVVVLFCALGAGAEETYVGHAVAMHGEPKYGADFTHFDYVNPDAPKGGDVRLAAIGTFDSLNPFILKGVPARGIGLVFDTLMDSSSDEAFTEYGLLAGTLEFPADRSWVTFTLREEARWHDGTPVTVEDVVFSFETLKKEGAPFYRAYYANVVSAEDLGERRVRFNFDAAMNRELPLIMGQLPVISKAYFSEHEFNATTLDPPLGSGPYRVERVEPGRAIVLRRDADYWGADLPINRGRYNFETIRYDYYRDDTVALEAFKAHEYDFRSEGTAKVWATAYTGPQFDSGLVKTEEIPHELPTGMSAFIFNTRRPMFQDPRVREALSYAFDFEWINKNLFYGAYARTASYFSNSELASSGLPSEAELTILDPYRGRIPDAVFTEEFKPPKTDGSGNNRRNLRQATKLLEEAGWVIEGNKRVFQATGAPMAFEFLLQAGTPFERVVAPFVRSLERLGIRVSIRSVDTAQYQKRIEDFDFDMMWGGFGQSLSPGNEQRDFWSSAAADTPGSRNVIGIKDPVIDALIDVVIAAPDREVLVAACHALDRVLLHGHYVVPLYHLRVFRVAYWDKFGRPAITPRYALGFADTWWVDADKARALQTGEKAVDKN